MSATVLDESALRFVTAQRVASAARLVTQGRVFDLAHILDEHVPSFPGRAFRQCLTSKPSTPIGRNQVSWIVEYVSAPSQIGTHMDALNHLHRAGRMFGGHAVRDVSAQWGTTRNGVETVPQIVTRGVLVDIAATRGVARLVAGDVVTPVDVEAALAASNLSIHPGDALLLHTGWGRLWDDDGEAYITGEPGPGVALGEWLARHGVAVTGCDTWSYGPVPAEDPDEPFVVPQRLNVDHGVIVLENLRLEEIAAAGATEFLFVVSHPKLRGATGAWVAPLAIL